MFSRLGLACLIGVICTTVVFIQPATVIACSPPPPPPWYTEIITVNPGHSLTNIHFDSVTRFDVGVGDVGYLRITNPTTTTLRLVQYVISAATPTSTPSAIRVAPILELNESLSVIHLSVRELIEFVPNIRRQYSGYYGEPQRPQNPPIPPPQNAELKFEYAGQIHFVPFQISYILNPRYRYAPDCEYTNSSPLDSSIFTGVGLMLLSVAGVWFIARLAVKMDHRKPS